MANFFDQFEPSAPKTDGGNFFDQFTPSMETYQPKEKDFGIDWSKPTNEIRNAISVLPDQDKQIAVDQWAKAAVKKEREGAPTASNNPIMEGVRHFGRGTILGSFFDEADAKVNQGLYSLSGGNMGAPEEERLAYLRARSVAEDEASPVLGTVAKLAGGFASGAPIANKVIEGAKSTAGKVIATGGVGGTAAAVYGFGEGEGGAENRLEKAAEYAPLGAALGVGAPIVAKTIGAGVQKAADYLPAVKARLPISKVSNPSEVADEWLASKLKRSGQTPQSVADDLAEGQRSAQLDSNSTALLPEMLADTSDTMRRLTGSVYRTGNEAGDLIKGKLDTRQRGPENPFAPRTDDQPQGQLERLLDSFARGLKIKSANSARVTEKDIIAAQRAEGNKLYGEARDASEAFDLQPAIDGVALKMQDYPPDVMPKLQRAVDLFTRPVQKGAAAKEDNLILKMQRLAEDEQDALARAADPEKAAAIEAVFAKKQRRLMEDLSMVQQQSRIFSAQRRAVDHVKQFDAAKKSLDDMIEAAKRGGENNMARELTEFKDALLNRVHEYDGAGVPTKNDKYQKARDSWGSHAENREAIELGRAALRENSEVSVEQFKALNEAQKKLFRIGLREGVRNAAGGKTPGDDLTRLFQTRRVVDLLREAIPATPIPKSRKLQPWSKPPAFSDRPQRFGDVLAREQRMVQTKNTAIGNSATAQRHQDDAEFASDALASILTGGRSLLNYGLEAVGVGLQKAFGYRQDVALELAKRLTEADPAKQAIMLANLGKKMGPSKLAEFLNQIGYSAGVAAVPASIAGSGKEP